MAKNDKLAKVPTKASLTRRQRDYVTVAASPEFKTIADVADRLGVTRQSAHEILTRPDVAIVLERERSNRLDKTRVTLEKITSAADACLAAVVEGNAPTDPAFATAMAKSLLETATIWQKLDAITGDKAKEQAERLEAGGELLERLKRRCLRVGAYLERRKWRARAIPDQ